MIRALHSSAAGMQSQQMSLDVIANNLANVQTTAFKKSKIEFQDVLYQTVRQPGAAQGEPTSCRPGWKSAMALKPSRRQRTSQRAS